MRPVNTIALEESVAGPIQNIGMAFYFDPATAAAATPLGLNVFEFYGLGRGGVLGDVSVEQVQAAFWFFHERAIASLFRTDKAQASAVAVAYLEAAHRFAEANFGGLNPGVLGALTSAARAVIDAVPSGRYALFDGYRRFAVPAAPASAAYQAIVILRELRGGVHIDSTRELGVAPNEACFITNETIFKLHGYPESDAPVRTPELEDKMARAEAATTETMAGYLEVLDEAQRAALVAGVTAMADRLAEAQGAAASQ